MFDIEFVRWERNGIGVDKRWVIRGYPTLKSAMLHVTETLPASDLDRIFITKEGVLYAEIKPYV